MTQPLEQASVLSKVLHATPQNETQFVAPPSGAQEPFTLEQVSASSLGPQTQETKASEQASTKRCI